jgi:hypothetical protein
MSQTWQIFFLKILIKSNMTIPTLQIRTQNYFCVTVNFYANVP